MVEFQPASGTLAHVRNLIAILLACGVTLSFGAASRAADEQQPGVVLTITGLAGSHPHESRIARLVALYVPSGTASASEVSPGPFNAEFSGNLNLRLRSYVKFHAEGRGKLTLLLNGATVLESSGDDLSKV